MASNLKKLAGAVYRGCLSSKIYGIPTLLAERDFRYFSYGRYALREAFVLSGVGEGDTVLLPEYVCRETLSAISALGAKVIYYPVNKEMGLAISPDRLPPARAIVAINYFGFPQDISPFETYCKRSEAILIEDNAHGFLSRDNNGVYLGTRGDVGIFSFRKTIPLINGSGIVVNNSRKTRALAPQLPFVSYGKSLRFRIKQILKVLPRWNLTWLLYLLIELERKIRVLRTGSEFVRSGDEEERVLPGTPEPDSGLLKALGTLDLECEISRRRVLYSEIEKAVVSCGGEPVYSYLPENVVPYGFPFYAALDRIPGIRAMLKGNYLDYYLWPELPTEIEQRPNTHYHSVWLVNFIW
jgi:hypothetical protein